ncbi:MAG: hypothetical protein IJ224_11500 [Lachnospiraceae bacterium]|nr:hypothetical protein [Lachnospiraceae bacterium]
MEKKQIIKNQTEQIYVKFKYKDTVFRMLYKSKKELLSLYNAVNGTDYINEEDLEIVTLENAVYMSIKNDISCLLDMNLQIYEHQSTVNPNMPLRFLMYITKQIEKIIAKKDIYSRKLIQLPNPRFIVFYNGVDEQPEKKYLFFSDSYEHKGKDVNLELKVLQLNINKGYNEHIKSNCPSLFQYMEYVDTVRKFARDCPLDEAVKKAVDDCIENDILKDFLLANKAEVISMSIFEYDEELHKKTLLAEGFEDGYNVGVEESKKTIAQKDETIENMQTELEDKQAEIDNQRAEIEQLKKLLNEKQ